jgi:hypothetical protein
MSEDNKLFWNKAELVELNLIPAAESSLHLAIRTGAVPTPLRRGRERLWTREQKEELERRILDGEADTTSSRKAQYEAVSRAQKARHAAARKSKRRRARAEA